MKLSSIGSMIMSVMAAGCVDRIDFDIEVPSDYPITIDGHISDRPGPYVISISKTFDIESKESFRSPVTVKRLTLADNNGSVEELSLIDNGIYQTDPNGMQGVAGGVYKLTIELFDGRIYESLPDTITATGQIDSLYTRFVDQPTDGGKHNYSFDISLDASSSENKSNRFIWKFVGTFKADTHPELVDTRLAGCNPLPDRPHICNYLPVCSGLRNIGGNSLASVRHIRVAPCTCCTCWYNIYNDKPILSDNLFTRNGRFSGVDIYNVPVNRWIFSYKIHISVDQYSLTNRAFSFYKAIKEQREAIGSLFQPVSGKIHSNFVQIAGDQVPITGIFYATSVTSKTLWITRNDIPIQNALAEDGFTWNDSCLTLFPNATTTEPAFWFD